MTQPITQQQPFEPLGPIMTTPQHNTPEYQTWDRFQKLEFLLDTTTEQFKQSLLDQIVSSMSEQEFDSTYEHITRMNGLARDYQELDRMSHVPQ